MVGDWYKYTRKSSSTFGGRAVNSFIPVRCKTVLTHWKMRQQRGGQRRGREWGELRNGFYYVKTKNRRNYRTSGSAWLLRTKTTRRWWRIDILVLGFATCFLELVLVWFSISVCSAARSAHGWSPLILSQRLRRFLQYRCFDVPLFRWRRRRIRRVPLNFVFGGRK